MYNVVNDFDEGDDLTVLKNQGMALPPSPKIGLGPFIRYYEPVTMNQYGPDSLVWRAMNKGEAFASKEIMIRERHIEKSTAEGRDSWTVRIKSILSGRPLNPGKRKIRSTSSSHHSQR